MTILGKSKLATSDNQLEHEDEENDVKRRTSPKALHEDLDGFGDQPGEKQLIQQHTGVRSHNHS